jgi:YD repeat-containing protein
MKKRYSSFRINIALIAIVQILLYQCNTPATDFIQPVPVALEASSITSTGFIASWKSVLGSTRYVVDVSTDPQFSSYVSGYQSRETDGTSLSITGIVAEVQYYYRVRSQKNNFISGNSNIITVTTAALSAPLATSATSKKVFQFTANWTPVTEAASYLLEVSTDSGFVNILTKYNNVEVITDSLVIEGLDYRTTYYYRVKAKRLEKTSGYSNIVEVVPCISANCKLSQMSNGYGEVIQFIYDDAGKLTSILNDYAGTYNITYNGNVPTTVMEYDDDVLTVTSELVYDANGLLQSVNMYDGDSQPIGVKDYLYNDKQQLVGFRQYDDTERTSLSVYQDYTIDANGNVLKILDASGSEVGQFRYDENFNPKMLIPMPLRQFILDDFSGYYFQPYLGLNNPIYAKGTFYPDFPEEEVFIYDINIRDVAFARKGYYKLNYEFTGCDF